MNESRQDFEDSGIDEATLQDLRTVSKIKNRFQLKDINTLKDMA